MKRIACNKYQDLPDEPDSIPDCENLELIIQPELEFPRHKWKCDFCLKTRPQHYLPYNYRFKFLHPSLFFGAFTEDGDKKLHTLNILAKRGASIVFLIDPENDNSLINACCLLKESFKDCINEEMSLTNVPFPVKKSDSDSKDWLWSCYWDECFPHRLNEKQSEEFVNKICLDFHTYDSRFFPVRATALNDEGVIAFDVQVGLGRILVVPHQGKILITVKDFPREINLEDIKRAINYDIKYKKQTYNKQATALSFLRLLTIYYASLGNNSFGFTIKNNLDSIFIVEPDLTQKTILWDCLFKTDTNNEDGSFPSTLNNIIELLLPEECKEEVKKIIVGRTKGDKRQKHDGYLREKLSNIKIEFNDAALLNFNNFKVTGRKQRDNDFANILPTFKSTIAPIISATKP